ncbi:DUF5947 family protein [Amycolatopsis sp. NPDC059657]|uniref:DUF5947 family protein n=1 Tax=Amycolatopsis sp. NPDC059657 TaxID=3346899 RepID=UPI00366EAFF1
MIEVCELCGTPVAARHAHLADTGGRRLLCACRACFLAFTHDSRYRAVPERYLWDPGRPITGIDWELLDTPADSAFFLRRGLQVTGFCPSPAGATECVLSPGLWTRLTVGHPLVTAAEPDVEAILLHKTARGTDCFLVPIDMCYRLVGTVRRHWTGLDGGRSMRARVEELFSEIKGRARQV